MPLYISNSLSISAYDMLDMFDNVIFNSVLTLNRQLLLLARFLGEYIYTLRICAPLVRPVPLSPLSIMLKKKVYTFKCPRTRRPLSDFLDHDLVRGKFSQFDLFCSTSTA